MFIYIQFQPAAPTERITRSTLVARLLPRILKCLSRLQHFQIFKQVLRKQEEITPQVKIGISSKTEYSLLSSRMLKQPEWHLYNEILFVNIYQAYTYSSRARVSVSSCSPLETGKDGSKADKKLRWNNRPLKWKMFLMDHQCEVQRNWTAWLWDSCRKLQPSPSVGGRNQKAEDSRRKEWNEKRGVNNNPVFMSKWGRSDKLGGNRFRKRNASKSTRSMTADFLVLAKIPFTVFINVLLR